MDKAKWILDPAHSELTFKVKHLMISNVKGEFKIFNASIDNEDFENGKVIARIDASSIFTNNDDRDNHLRSADFFDVEKFPGIIFESTKFEKVSDEEYKLRGNLTIKDVTKEITLNVEYGGSNKDPWGNTKAGFSLTGKINRKDWGLNWNAALEAGGVLVGDDISISGEVQFAKQA
ncbi:YceI family protein [Xiashengella succiniciproducens]|jgi:polyisoprenoid-binding protein YceI|uniref:YceI family protein n=1 Tax=Xiashengella succiniciproducens TaxID=2949635 RepID=A0A9J6ZPM4_9BACT|nr:YceI family protein [Alkaliflexus sp. Ai-910]MDI9539542.1 YceI family protein [Bacteroidota bacterium]URW79208.1 YceI family protein [Alkaliflexus sp. Ai-910]HHU00712.1 YceI family protein [Bacteroidales bacterium]